MAASEGGSTGIDLETDRIQFLGRLQALVHPHTQRAIDEVLAHVKDGTHCVITQTTNGAQDANDQRDSGKDPRSEEWSAGQRS